MKRFFLPLLVTLFLAVPCQASVALWDHDGDNTLGYRLYYGEESGSWPFLVADISATDTWVALWQLPDGYYVVKAYNEDGESGPSNEVHVAGYYFNVTRYDYNDSGRLLYKGQHTDQNASPDDGNWVITKYYYDENGMPDLVRIRTTSWTLRDQGW